ncbi:MAG: hypothetical protein HY397_01435 [Candidatus Doudnabacteria bacterium]|nr:hypothetical protein [Candidatus Doudnabacteria bacterium]
MAGPESESFQSRMDELKKPRREAGEGTEETRDIVQAIDIITALRKEVYGKNDVAWQELWHATDHLNKLLKEHLESPEEPK